MSVSNMEQSDSYKQPLAIETGSKTEASHAVSLVHRWPLAKSMGKDLFLTDYKSALGSQKHFSILCFGRFLPLFVCFPPASFQE